MLELKGTSEILRMAWVVNYKLQEENSTQTTTIKSLQVTFISERAMREMAEDQLKQVKASL